LLRAFDPEDAHSLTIKALKFAPRSGLRPAIARLQVRAFGLNFPNPVGMRRASTSTPKFRTPCWD
jgi:dihydroorotate dehydrogenase